MHTLVLNVDYQAITVCSPERAIILILQEKATLVNKVPKKFFKSKSLVLEFPSIIRLNRYVNIPYKKVHFTRQNVFKRDEHKCAYCGSTKDLTLDHVIPRSKGGKHSWKNVVACCKKCNYEKADNFLEDTDMELRIVPHRPNYMLFVTKNYKRIPEDWKPYLYMT